MSGISEAFSPSVGPILTPEEQVLFAYLESVKSHANNTTSTNRTSSSIAVSDLRVCGGWMRDKLLDRVSHDVDIAVEGMTGCELVDLVSKFESDHGHKLERVGVTKANPGQSKHLEVVTIRVGDMEESVDFVNLRAALFSKHNGSPKRHVASESVKLWFRMMDD